MAPEKKISKEKERNSVVVILHLEQGLATNLKNACVCVCVCVCMCENVCV
jgi:hypothetical protein